MFKKQFLEPDRLKIANMTQQWFYTDTPERYREVKDKVSYGPGDFIYTFNNRGFRCDDFENWKQHPIRILFAGCSYTEGVGIPLDKVWAKLFHNLVCEKLDTQIPFWSIAHGGASMDHLVKHLHNEGDILQPQIVISLLPQFERRERWSGDHWGPWATNSKEDNQAAKTFLKDEYVCYQTERNLSFINALMDKWDSIFLYAKNDPKYDLSYINFPRFTMVNSFMDYVDLGRDGWHGGPESNRLFAEKMFDNLWPHIQTKLGL